MIFGNLYAINSLYALFPPFYLLYVYSKVFNVVSKAKVTNIAYLEVPLEFHQDLPYYESPPGLQFLHCIRSVAKTAVLPEAQKINY